MRCGWCLVDICYVKTYNDQYDYHDYIMQKARGAMGKSRFKKRNSPLEETALHRSHIPLGGVRMVGEDNNIFTQPYRAGRTRFEERRPNRRVRPRTRVLKPIRYRSCR